MHWHPFIEVNIRHDLFDVISLFVNLVLGATAIYSLWLSRKVFKKSEFDSSMSTSPSVVIRPRNIWVGIRNSEIEHGYGVVNTGNIIKKKDYYQIVFCIEFECFNAGRGVAFNLSQAKATGMPISDFRDNKVPLYLTTDDEAFEIEIMTKGTFDDLYKNAEREVPVIVTLLYTNDQNNIHCRSTWKANIKPFDREGEDLKVRETRLLQRSGRIEYSQEPFKNEN